MRKAVPDDEAFLFQLYASTRQEELAVWGWQDQQRDHFLRMQFSLQQQSYSRQYPEAEHFILENPLPFGRMLLQYEQHEILLVDLSLLPSSRNAGVGTALLKELQKEAVRSHRRIRLHVFHSNQAQRLYERLGFQKLAEESMYIAMQWQPGMQ